MINKFLLAKHWQIFIITVGLPFFFQIKLVPMWLSNDPTRMIIYYFIVMILFTTGYLGWFWSVGVGLQSRIPTHVKMKIGRFKTFLIIQTAIVILMLGFMVFSFNLEFSTGLSGAKQRMGMLIKLVVVIFPLLLFSVFCLFYCFYFAAKAIKTAELHKEVKFKDFSGEFFMICFFPVGIWLIQPQINKIRKD